MTEQSNDQGRTFVPIDAELPDKQQAKVFGGMAGWYENAPEDASLLPDDIEQLRQFLREGGPHLRKAVVAFLCDFGPVTWEDLETWALDPDKDVRNAAMFGMELSYKAATELCASDKPRCAALLAQVIEQHKDGYAGIVWSVLAGDDEWLAAIWPEVERLVDLNDDDIDLILQCGFVEDMLHHHHRMAPDDPRIVAWVKGKSRRRKQILLEIANWGRFEDPALVHIVEALMNDPDQEISLYATKMRDWYTGGREKAEAKQRRADDSPKKRESKNVRRKHVDH